MTYSGVLADAKDSGAELKTIQTERSFAVASVMQLSIEHLFMVELDITVTKN